MSELWLRLRALFRRRRMDRELEEEMRLNVELLSEEDAESARRQFGNATLLSETSRDVWGWLERLGQDLRYAVRMMRRNPAFTSVAVLTLALGIGANTAIFSVVNDFLIRPLPFREPGRLVTVTQHNPKAAENTTGYTAPANYLDWKAQNHVFEDMAAWDVIVDQFNLTGAEEPERVRGARVSASFFPVLGVSPLLGRTFSDQDSAALIGYALWQRRFGGKPDIVGREITLDGRRLSIAGVMPRGFRFSMPPEEVWAPLGRLLNGGRGGRHLKVIARLKPGVGLAQAQGEMNAIAARLALEYPRDNRDERARVDGLRERYARRLRPALAALLAAVALVLLIGCANVAGLLLARATARRREMAVRRALGAGRARITRQVLTESILLALAGGGFGSLLAVWGVRLMYAAVPVGMHPLEPAGVDGSVLAVTLLTAVLTGLLFGAVPAWNASSAGLIAALKERAGGLGRSRWRGALVVGEVALAVLLLVGAGLLLKSFVRLLRMDSGFRSENVLTLGISRTRQAPFYNEVLERIAALPGVRAAGAANFIPINPQGWGQDIYIEGRPPRLPGDFIWAQHRSVSLDYFRAIGMRLVAGRQFTPQDRRLRVSVVNQTMARTFWPNEDPIGKRFKIGIYSNEWISVAGVVADTKSFGLEAEVVPEMYFLESMPRMTLVVRADMDPASLVAAVRGAIRAVDPEQPVSDIRTMEKIVAESVAPRRLTMVLTGMFAALALALAGIGLYGLMAYSVAQRRHEIGIRMALGAGRSDVVRGILARGVGLSLLGAMIGLAAAWALAGVMAGLLFGITPRYPAVFLTAPLTLVIVAVMATLIPARRATRIDPMEALRYE